MAGNSADPFGDYTDDELTEDGNLSDYIDDALDSDEPLEDVIPVGQQHAYLLVKLDLLPQLYQVLNSSSSGTMTCGSSCPLVGQQLKSSTPTTCTTQSLAPPPPTAPASLP